MVQRNRQHFPIYKNTGGFTIMELMVVFAIIGVLASIAITSFMSTRTKVLEAAALAEAQSLGKVVLNAFLDGLDVDLTHNSADGPVIGELDNAGNARRPLFTLGNGLVADITGTSDWHADGSGFGVCIAKVWHPSSPLKWYWIVIDETTDPETFSFPTS